MLNIFASLITIFILISFIGLLLQKDILTKFVFLNFITNLAILFIVTLGSYKYNESFIDIAIIYALLSFIASEALLRFISR